MLQLRWPPSAEAPLLQLRWQLGLSVHQACNITIWLLLDRLMPMHEVHSHVLHHAPMRLVLEFWWWKPLQQPVLSCHLSC